MIEKKFILLLVFLFIISLCTFVYFFSPKQVVLGGSLASVSESLFASNGLKIINPTLSEGQCVWFRSTSSLDGSTLLLERVLIESKSGDCAGLSAVEGYTVVEKPFYFDKQLCVCFKQSCEVEVNEIQSGVLEARVLGCDFK